ncbi:MAG: winged helix DNA-binding domain-containing protein [Acidimicrobiales bacterium]
MRTISVAERRARLAVRHRLAPSARIDDDVAAIARSVVVLHATDPLTVVLSTLVRMRTPDQSLIQRALFDDRTVVRMLAMRRTLFGVAIGDMARVQAAASDAVAANERKRLAKMIEDAGVTDDGGGWLDQLTADALAAMDELGQATATQLADAVPALATRITLSPGKRYESTTSLASRILLVLGAEGHFVRGRPRGRWTGTQHHWTTPHRWLDGRLPDPIPTAAAQTELVRAWLGRFGPGTVADLKWWTGWNLGTTRAAIARLDTVEVDLDGAVGLVLAEDIEPVPPQEPWAALLPALDPTIMGWYERDWYLGNHRAELFDTAGNAGPTIWVDGRAVGAWGQRKDGEIVVELLEDIGRERTADVAAEAQRVRAMLGDTMITFRFTSALGRRLVE